MARSTDLNPATKEGAYLVDCFMDDMEIYYAGGASALPFNLTGMKAVMEGNPASFPPQVYRTTPFFPPAAENTLYVDEGPVAP